MKCRQFNSRRFLVLIILSLLVYCSAWEWTDFVGGLGSEMSFQTKTLSLEEVRLLRVREIKRRLARSHGYSADELGRMLDKKELIQALSFEEHKEREKERQQLKRNLLIRGIVIGLIAIVVVMGWPVWQHLYEVASVNFVVYVDRKKHEASRCLELKSAEGMLGVLLMAIVDTLQLWLSASIVSSPPNLINSGNFLYCTKGLTLFFPHAAPVLVHILEVFFPNTITALSASSIHGRASCWRASKQIWRKFGTNGIVMVLSFY
eukprot:scaffold1736_cov127-Cylindrotheca_fusiformis.AAC.76